MKTLDITVLCIGLLSLSLFTVGCGTSQEPAKPQAEHRHDEHVDEAEIKSNLAKLNEEDRALAEAQGFCVSSDEPLGAMGVPLKLTLKDGTAFVCCKGCEKKALRDPEKTLAKVETLKGKVKAQQTD